jgi:hypothetical protein
VSTAPPEIDEIRRKMAQIRHDLHTDVQGVVQGAEAATDWRRFIRGYPLAMMGAALVVGYLVVPRRHRGTSTIPQIAPAEIARAATFEDSTAVVPEKKSKGLLGTVFSLVAPVAVRAAQGYALQFAEQWLSQRVAQQMQIHPELAEALRGSRPSPHEPSGPQGPRVGPRL